MLADLDDPSRVVLRDRSGTRPRPLLERIRIPRSIVVPVILVLVVGSLLTLTWLMGNAAGRRGRRPIPPASGEAPGRGR